MSLFTPFSDVQRTSHCGPTALASALFVLGHYTTQDDLVQLAGLTRKYVSRNGMDERELMGVARKFGVEGREVVVTEEERHAAFLKPLRGHLLAGFPALLLVMDFDHWVVVVGECDGKFVVSDPLNASRIFDYWSEKRLLREAWNTPAGRGEAQYCALLFRGEGGPRWHLTESFRQLCARGSDATAESIAADLEDLVEPPEGRFGRVLEVRDALQEYEAHVLESVLQWGEGVGFRAKQLRDFYRDYIVVAESLDLRMPVTYDRARWVAQLTALFSAYWWGAAF